MNDVAGSGSEEDDCEDVVADGGTASDNVVREISHDEFDPVGTYVLAFLYLGLLVVLWLFMYFVEFLGNGPTVVG